MGLLLLLLLLSVGRMVECVWCEEMRNGDVVGL